MPNVKLSKNIISEAKVASKVLKRSVDEQIEHWAQRGKIAEENPELTYEFIKTILASQQDAFAGKLDLYKLE